MKSCAVFSAANKSSSFKKRAVVCFKLNERLFPAIIFGEIQIAFLPEHFALGVLHGDDCFRQKPVDNHALVQPALKAGTDWLMPSRNFFMTTDPKSGIIF